MSDGSRTQFPGGCHRCCLIKVELFHRRAEVCEGASERPDERTESSREKLLPFFFFFFWQLCSGSPPCLHAPQAPCQSLFTELVLVSVACSLLSLLLPSSYCLLGLPMSLSNKCSLTTICFISSFRTFGPFSPPS